MEGSERSNDVAMLDSMFQEQQTKSNVEQVKEKYKILQERLKTAGEQFAEERKKQENLVWFYRKENEKKEEIIAKLNTDIQELVSSSRKQKETFDDRLKTMSEKQNVMKKSLENHLDSLTRDNKSLKDFSERKKEMEDEIALLKKTLENDEREHTRNINDLERRNVSVKERLKKEMLLKIKETKLSLLAMTEDQLNTTTKRTIMENEQISIELQYQSKETERLIERNEKLVHDNASTRRKLKLQKDTERILATRTHLFQKQIAKLKKSLKNKENNKRKTEDQSSQPQLGESHENNASQARICTLELQEKRLKDERDQAIAKLNTMRTILKSQRKDLNSFLKLQDESITLVWTRVLFIRERIQELNGETFVPSQTRISLQEQEDIFEKLYARLKIIRHSWDDIMGSVSESVDKLSHNEKLSINKSDENVTSVSAIDETSSHTDQQYCDTADDDTLTAKHIRKLATSEHCMMNTNIQLADKDDDRQHETQKLLEKMEINNE